MKIAKKLIIFCIILYIIIMAIMLYTVFNNFNNINKFTSFLFVMLITILIIIVFESLGNLFGFFVRKLKQSDKNKFILDKEYYREIINEYTPLILSYITDLNVDKSDLVAMLLFLENQNYIEAKNGILERKKQCLTEDCTVKRVLPQVVNGKLRIRKLNDFVIFESKKLGLIKDVGEHKKNDGFDLSFLIMFFLVCLFSAQFSISTLIGGIMTFFICVFVEHSFIEGFYRKEGKLYKRTAKGRELNQKLEGLKNYLKDYSLMDEREAKEIELWDDYLIYSVMFGQNKKIIEEYEKYIEIIE